jgi:hypothetical protein
MLLGMASLATPEVWLTLRQPPADPANSFVTARTLQAAGKDNFLATILYDAPVAVPLRVQYTAARRKVVTTFGDRRKIGALLLPHTMMTTRDGETVEELTFHEIVVNAPLTRADFVR